jgi:hypothetical protein
MACRAAQPTFLSSEPGNIRQYSDLACCHIDLDTTFIVSDLRITGTRVLECIQQSLTLDVTDASQSELTVSTRSRLDPRGTVHSWPDFDCYVLYNEQGNEEG